MPKKLFPRLVYILLLAAVVLLPASAQRSSAIAVAAAGYIKWVDFNATSEI